MVGFGVYTGNDPSSVSAFETWAGKPLEFLAAHVGQANWRDWTTSLTWLADQFKDVDATLTWSIPMFADGGSLAAGARGSYNGHYRDAAEALVARYADQDKIYVRVGEEFNGDWMTWAAAGKERQFIQTYRNFVDTFRSVSDKFVFEWNVNVGDYGMNPANAYPGDDYVDIIGMDFYYNTKWDSKDPVEAWDWMVSRKYGLQWLEDFAEAHGKPTAYSEWGVNSDAAAAYIAAAKDWFDSHDVVYQQYWNSNAAFTGEVSGTQYANAAAAYLEAFGAADSDTAAMKACSVSGTTYTLLDASKNVSLTGSDDIDLVGNWRNNTLTGNGGNNTLYGMAGNDLLIAGDGNDTLIGGTGIDRMRGGKGDDIYSVDSEDDEAIEAADEGIDTVRSAGTYALGANIENLQLLYGGNSYGTGNDLANRITGNSGDNVLYGMAGDDVLLGGLGDDTLVGGIGADTMVGGAGDDVYYVDDPGDTVTEVFGEGTDTVRTGISYVLGDNVENLDFLYNGDTYGTGNDLANVITGNRGDNVLFGRDGDDTLIGWIGNDTLDGGAGADVMKGGVGNDTYIVDNVDDQVVEWANQGTDTVKSFISYTLGDNVEYLELLASGPSYGIGNARGNTITGNDGDNFLRGMGGNDQLIGGAGADTLTGGSGNDRFIFRSTADSSPSDPDLITDLQNPDVIDLSLIDANVNVAGNQAFVQVSSFSNRAAQAMVTYDAQTKLTTLSLDSTGDGRADSTITVAGNHSNFSNWIW